MRMQGSLYAKQVFYANARFTVCEAGFFVIARLAVCEAGFFANARFAACKTGFWGNARSDCSVITSAGRGERKERND